MSSIYGFVSDRELPDCRGRLSAMARALPESWEARGAGWISDDQRAAFGFGSHLRTPLVGQTAVDPHSGVRCWLEGTFDEPVLGSDRPADGFVRGFLDSGPECVDGVRGAFNVAWWVPGEGKLVLANDHAGYRPLYIGRAREVTVFSTHMPQLAAARLVNLEPDPEAFSSLLGLNTLLEDETIFQAVRVLPPASLFEVRGGKRSIRRYWSLSDIQTWGTYDRARRDLLTDTFVAATRRSLGTGTSSLAMTGGLDSRCVAAAAAQCGLTDTFTEGHSDSDDFRIAEQVTTRLGLRHRHVPIDDEVAGWLEPAAILLGGNVASIEVHPCRHFLGAGETSDRVVLGLMGEAARAAYPRPTDFRAPDFETLFLRVRRKIRSSAARDPQYGRMWLPEFSSLAGLSEERLRRTLGAYAWQDTPLDVADCFYLEQRGPRQLSKGPTLGRLGTESSSPYLDREWLETVLAVPTRERLRNRIQIDIIERLAPGLKSLRFAAPRAYTSRWQERIGERRKRMRRRMRQRMRLGDSGSPPAFDTVGWSRGALRPALEELLYRPDAAYRDFLDEGEVRQRLHSHFSGVRNHTHLVAALSTFELAVGWWADCGDTHGNHRQNDERTLRL